MLMKVGEFLKEYRRIKNITIEDVAKATKMLTKYIISLEESEYWNFPAMVYAKGFLRLYGEYLDIKGEELTNLLTRYEYEFKEYQNKKNNTPLKKSNNNLFIILPVISLILFGGALISLKSAPLPSAPASQEPILTIEALQRTWVEVEDSNKERERILLNEKDSISYRIDDELTLRIGDPKALRVLLSGKALNFISYTQGEIELTFERKKE